MPVLPEFSLSGRVAVFATAGGDEGPLLASALAEGGATVFVVARTQQLLDGVMAALGDGGHGGVASALESAAEVERVMGELEASHGGAHILVNDPRSFFAKPLAEITWEEWEEVQARNLRSAFMLCQAVGKRMVERGYGRIVNVVSVMAERGVINCSAYAATQAGLLSLTRTMAVEWGKANVRANALGIGWTLGEDIPVEEQQEELLVRYTPLRRKGHPRDIGGLLVYLCSEACDYETGQAVYVDGGLNAHP